MSTRMVGTVTDMPGIECGHIPVNLDNNVGFPFDDQDFDREGYSFRSQLDDLAKRHPEFAEHLNFGSNFPSRSHTLGRHRRGSDLNSDSPSGSQETEFRRHADRPFGSRFEQFGFPFSRHFNDEPDIYYTKQPQQQANRPDSSPKEPSSPQPTAEKPPQVPQGQDRGRKQNIQQSNTVDLGQKQDPVDENRSQRSMSAPPENRSTGQRFVSSINIPIQRPGGGDMGARTSQPAESHSHPQPQSQNRPTERVIPIHVEGRDEPVIPKNVNVPHSSPQPQSERIFGRAPSHFTQFINKGEPHGLTPEEIFRQQQQQHQKPQQNYQQQQQQNQQSQQQPQAAQQQHHEQQMQQEPPQKSYKPGQLDQIQIIQKDVSELMNKVEKFDGKPKDKEYLYLDEMLTRNLIKLDNIETEGKDNIRQARKEAIKCIEGCIGILEAKAKANAAVAEQTEEKMEVEKSSESQPSEPEQSNCELLVPSTDLIASEKQHAMDTEPATLEVSGVTRSGSVVNAITEESPMEVVQSESVTKETEKQSITTDDIKMEFPPEEAHTVDAVIEDKSNTEVKVEENIENKASQEEPKAENVEVTPGAETSQNNETKTEVGVKAEEKKEEKKEKKKGKKKEKTENK